MRVSAAVCPVSHRVPRQRSGVLDFLAALLAAVNSHALHKRVGAFADEPQSARFAAVGALSVRLQRFWQNAVHDMCCLS